VIALLEQNERTIEQQSRTIAALQPRPIETAPRDGWHFRGLEVTNNVSGKTHWEWFMGQIDDETGEWHDVHDNDCGWTADDFTHWLPLPQVSP
jgi:hypothetical protein